MSTFALLVKNWHEKSVRILVIKHLTGNIYRTDKVNFKKKTLHEISYKQK